MAFGSSLIKGQEKMRYKIISQLSKGKFSSACFVNVMVNLYRSYFETSDSCCGQRGKGPLVGFICFCVLFF